MGKLCGCLVLALLLVSCGRPETRKVGREFSSMKDCLEFISQDTNDALKTTTDSPGDISGRTVRDNLFFRCEARVTGTRGLILEGRWERLK